MNFPLFCRIIMAAVFLPLPLGSNSPSPPAETQGRPRGTQRALTQKIYHAPQMLKTEICL